MLWSLFHIPRYWIRWIHVSNMLKAHRFGMFIALLGFYKQTTQHNDKNLIKSPVHWTECHFPFVLTLPFSLHLTWPRKFELDLQVKCQETFLKKAYYLLIFFLSISFVINVCLASAFINSAPCCFCWHLQG